MTSCALLLFYLWHQNIDDKISNIKYSKKKYFILSNYSINLVILKMGLFLAIVIIYRKLGIIIRILSIYNILHAIVDNREQQYWEAISKHSKACWNGLMEY